MQPDIMATLLFTLLLCTIGVVGLPYARRFLLKLLWKYYFFVKDRKYRSAKFATKPEDDPNDIVIKMIKLLARGMAETDFRTAKVEKQKLEHRKPNPS